jgi:hypothetical protein
VERVGRRELELAHAVGPVERDVLAEAAGRGEAEPDRGPARAAAQGDRAPRQGAGAEAVDHALHLVAGAFEHRVHEVDVVDQRAEERVRRRGGAAEPERLAETRVVGRGGDVDGRLGEIVEERLDRRVEALHVADLDDDAGPVAGRDDLRGLVEREAERLLDQDVHAGRESVERDGRVGGVRRADEQRVDRAEELAMAGVTGRDAVTRAQALARGCVGLRQRDDAELLVEPLQQRQVHGLGDEPASDHADADGHGERFDHRRTARARHRSRPSLVERQDRPWPEACGVLGSRDANDPESTRGDGGRGRPRARAARRLRDAAAHRAPR